MTDLADAGYVTRERVGQRNRYTVNGELQVRHRAQLEHDIRELVDLLRSVDAARDASA